MALLHEHLLSEAECKEEKAKEISEMLRNICRSGLVKIFKQGKSGGAYHRLDWNVPKVGHLL